MFRKDQESRLGEQAKGPASLIFKCRRARVTSFNGLDIEQLVRKQGCPMEGRIETINVSDLGKLEESAAKTFNEKCGVCGLTPDKNDFRIT